MLAIDWTRGNPFDVAIKSDERRTRVNIAFGLEDPASDDPGADKRPPGPAVLRSALLFTVAFCQRLPGPAFRRFARSCLNGETRVRFADLDDMDRRHFEELKTVVPDGTNIADELPLLTAYFDKWADRLLQYDDIRPRPDGRYELGKEWGSFDLAGHIGSAAPMTAAAAAAAFPARDCRCSGPEWAAATALAAARGHCSRPAPAAAPRR